MTEPCVSISGHLGNMAESYLLCGPARPGCRVPADTVTTPGAGAEIIADTGILSSGDKIQLLRNIGIKDSFNR